MHINVPSPLAWNGAADLGALNPAAAGQSFPVPTEKLNLVPRKIHGYRHNVDAQRWLMHALTMSLNQEGCMPLLFWGPKGSGKTSEAEQCFAALGIPMARRTASPRDLASDMLCLQSFNQEQGHHLVPGPMFDAFTRGYPFMLNEAFVMDPAELASLNDLIERGVYTLPNGDEIEASPGFLLILTDNTNGQGDLSGRYAGVQIQNGSVLDRLTAIQFSYLPESEEIEAAVAPFATDPQLEAQARIIAAKAVELANMVRASTIMGGEFSTRVVTSLVRDTLAFAGLEARGLNPFFFCIKARILAKLRDEERAALVTMLEGMNVRESA